MSGKTAYSVAIAAIAVVAAVVARAAARPRRCCEGCDYEAKLFLRLMECDAETMYHLTRNIPRLAAYLKDESRSRIDTPRRKS